MGKPKMVLPWGRSTVIGQVLMTLVQAGVHDILVVTGGAKCEVEITVQQIAIPGVTIRTVYNPGYAQGEMLSSLQVGLSHLGDKVEAALITLGDQPQIQARVIRSVIDIYQDTDFPLIVPSYKMRRGHPWLIDRSLWRIAMSLQPPFTLRDFLTSYASQIRYVNVDTESILQDLDTPADYDRFCPNFHYTEMNHEEEEIG
jgi:molybdenum cofactor cytidylyltransferase